jgi:hypothetical protein
VVTKIYANPLVTKVQNANYNSSLKMQSNAIVQIVSCPSEESEEDAPMLNLEIKKNFF